ncbi:hypothetical protein DD607_28545 [Salmonella sp. 3DZ2-4SM]|nr:hypothetical protein DD607_28545 [Salmonella sp. 3DZ2-4SM]
MAEIEIPIVTKRNQMTGDYEYPQTHVNGVVGLDEYVENAIQENIPEIPEIEFSDTGWIPYAVPTNVEKDTLFKANGENGFNCGYRIINILGAETFYIRFNLKNIEENTLIQIPSGLIENTQSFTLRSGSTRAPVKGVIKPDGSIRLYPVTSDSNWTSSDYVYQEVSFLNN